MASSLKAEDGHRRLGRSNLLPFRHKMPTRVSLVDSFLHASGANSRLRQRCARAEPRLSPRAKQPSGYEIHPLRARALRRRAKSAHIRSAWDAVAGASQHGRRPSLQHRQLICLNTGAQSVGEGTQPGPIPRRLLRPARLRPGNGARNPTAPSRAESPSASDATEGVTASGPGSGIRSPWPGNLTDPTASSGSVGLKYATTLRETSKPVAPYIARSH